MCPQCGKASEVIDTRVIGTRVRRRPRCLNEHRFSTFEDVIDPLIEGIRKVLRKLEV